MPPLIRRSQSAVPRHAGEDGGHSGIGSHPTARHGSALSQCAAGRSVTGPAAADTRQRTRPGQAPVNGLLPVRIAANRVRELDALRGEPDEVRARLSEHIPLRRYPEPEEFG
jgi:hypothetical protein